ncbi:unnamed protein product [Mytilus edulis]|uniref:B box-type domain-containing protein n=1 Tax=Mytilus edulis TaxID=6550 RepID=A0A8S3TS95_MYTED|nr:unnamed protein product [Mytilus edulis]
MASSSQSCGVCDLRHITKPSIVWCTECDEGLCTECQEHHRLSKASKPQKSTKSSSASTEQSVEFEKRKEIEKEIQNSRIKINNHLDKLQEDFMKQLNEHEVKENSKICQLLSSLEKKEKEIGEYQNSLLNIKKHATDLQMFLSMKQIEQVVYSKENILQSFEEGKKQHTLSYKINTSIQNIISDIRSFGEVCIKSKYCDIVLIEKKAKQAQIMVPMVQSRSFENIKLTKHKNINNQGRFIYGCCILPDGRLAFTYLHEKTVKVFRNNGSIDLEVKMPFDPFDIEYINEDNSLAVTSDSAEKRSITIIDLRENKSRKQFQ